jgi:hypothetical protein
MSETALVELTARAELLEPSDQSIAFTQFHPTLDAIFWFQHIASTLGVVDVLGASERRAFARSNSVAAALVPHHCCFDGREFLVITSASRAREDSGVLFEHESAQWATGCIRVDRDENSVRMRDHAAHSSGRLL